MKLTNEAILEPTDVTPVPRRRRRNATKQEDVTPTSSPVIEDVTIEQATIAEVTPTPIPVQSEEPIEEVVAVPVAEAIDEDVVVPMDAAVTQGRGKRKKKYKPEKAKKPSWFSMYKAQIEGYGFNYSFKSFLMSMSVTLVAFSLLGYLFELTPLFIGIVTLFVALMLPVIVKAQYRYVYEQRRFQELKTYMDTMAHSFAMKPKILNSLRDTLEIADTKYPNLAVHLRNAIHEIETSKSPTVYRDALDMIRKHYECSRIVALNEFMIDVEMQGGEYQTSLHMLIDDMTGWEQRTYLFQTDRRDVKNKILLSIIISTGVCATTLFMLPGDMSITGELLYKITTTLALMSFVGIYTYTQTAMNGSWLENDSKIDIKQIDRDFATLKQDDSARNRKKAKNITIAMVPLILVGVFMQNYMIIGLSVLMIFYGYMTGGSKKKSAKKRLTRALQKEIPTWCRKVALRLHTDNVQVAIMKSRDDCAYVLQGPLDDLLASFEAHPDSIIPYDSFLSDFDIPEAGRMMKTLYAISKQGSNSGDEQVNKIIEQNNAMIAKAEHLKNEDSIASASMIFLAPMLLGSIKMIADLFLFCMNFMDLSGGIM